MQGPFCPPRGSDPAAVHLHAGPPEPRPGGPGQQRPLAMQVSILLRVQVRDVSFRSSLPGELNSSFPHLLFFHHQPPAGMNHHHGPGRGAPAEEPVGGGLAHLADVGSCPGSLQLGQMSSPTPDGHVFPPTHFQPAFIPPRLSGAPARPPDFPESSEISPSHVYRPDKDLNRVHPAVWNGNHGAANSGPLGPDEKTPMGPGPSHQPRTLGPVMDSRVLRPPLPPHPQVCPPCP